MFRDRYVIVFIQAALYCFILICCVFFCITCPVGISAFQDCPLELTFIPTVLGIFRNVFYHVFRLRVWLRFTVSVDIHCY